VATLSELQAAREELLKRRHSGIARVTVDGRTIEYRSQAEIDQALAALDRELESAEGKTPIRTVLISGGKGL
jgi:hypothetical protein